MNLKKVINERVRVLYPKSSFIIDFQRSKNNSRSDIMIDIHKLAVEMRGQDIFTLGNSIGRDLKENLDEVRSFTLSAGFLNIKLSEEYLEEIKHNNEPVI